MSPSVFLKLPLYNNQYQQTHVKEKYNNSLKKKIFTNCTMFQQVKTARLNVT